MSDEVENLKRNIEALRLHHKLLKEELNKVSRAINRRVRKLKRLEEAK